MSDEISATQSMREIIAAGYFGVNVWQGFGENKDKFMGCLVKVERDKLLKLVYDTNLWNYQPTIEEVFRLLAIKAKENPAINATKLYLK